MPHFLSFILLGPFFIAKVTDQLGTNQRKLRCAKKNVIISPAHLSKLLQDTHKINIKCEVFTKTHTNDIWEDYCIALFLQKKTDLAPRVNLLLTFLTKHHEHPSASTETQLPGNASAADAAEHGWPIIYPAIPLPRGTQMVPRYFAHVSNAAINNPVTHS